MNNFKFTAAPPLRNLKIKIEEWDPEAEFTISELRANECQDLVGLVNKIQGEGALDTKGIELYADLLSRCLTNSDGDPAPKEWLMQASFKTLKRIGDEALKINGFTAETGPALEKN